MIDQTTQQPMVVSTDGMAGPYIKVPMSQVDGVRKILDSASIGYWVDREAISLDGEPAITVVNLRRGADVESLQSLLDQAQ